MRRLSSQEIDEFLARPLVCRLGCLDEQGFPHVVPCLYLYEDGGFYLGPRARSSWAHYLSRDGRVCLCIDVSYDEPRVQVKGIAERLDGPRVYGTPRDDDPMYRISVRLTTRYWGGEEAARQGLETYRDEPFWWFFVRPQEMTTFRGGDWAQRYKHVDQVY
jgi:hypothetical protein